MKKYILGLAALAAVASSCVKDDVYKAEVIVIDYSGLVINEIDGNGKFVELYNNGPEALPLQNVRLMKNDSEQWWKGDANASIQPGGFFTIAQVESTVVGADLYNGAGGISGKKTVKFALFVPDNNIAIDSYYRTGSGLAMDANCAPDYSKDIADGGGGKYSFSRCPNGTGNFGLAVPSCNMANPTTAAGPIVTNP